MIDLSFMAGRAVGVMGLGKSGLAVARALAIAGADVRAWDDRTEGRARAAAAGVPLADLGGAGFDGITALVLSPGIPHTWPAPHPVAARARLAGVEIIGDIELLGRAEPAAGFLGITGTNGKSTTTALIGHLLAAAGQRIAVGGNLGPTVSDFPALGAGGWYALEMSSYQLELTFSIAYDVAVLTNITPDHLGRHGGLEGYIHAKGLIFSGRDRHQTAVIGVDDAPSRAIAQRLVAEGHWTVIPVSVSGEALGGGKETGLPAGVYVRDGLLIDATEEVTLEVLDLTRAPALPGRHNWQNAALAYAAAVAAGASPAQIAAALPTFPGLAHRQQCVAEIAGAGAVVSEVAGAGAGGAADGGAGAGQAVAGRASACVRFVNDSKATNADAAARALVCYPDIYWIAGGLAKEGGLEGLEGLLGAVRHAFLIGAAEADFAAWLEGRVPYSRCGTLAQATRAACARARADQAAGIVRGPATVLLSPACASFDQFANFEQRGDAFAALAAEIVADAGGTAPDGMAPDKTPQDEAEVSR